MVKHNNFFTYASRHFRAGFPILLHGTLGTIFSETNRGTKLKTFHININGYNKFII